MSLWRSILRWFGISHEARVQITAPGIEVTLRGEPSQVRALMGVIRNELERKARRERRMNKLDASQVVRPRELDEMDSPYALPEAVVMPVPDDAEDRRPRLMAMSARDPDTMPPISADGDPLISTVPSSPGLRDDDEPEQVHTALTAHPSDERPTPPVAQGVRAVSADDRDTLEVDRRRARPPPPPKEA